MMPHHLRALLVILAFPLAYVVGHSLYQVYLDHWRTPTPAPVNTARIQYPNYHSVALDALADFSGLDTDRQAAIRRALVRHLVGFDAWIRGLARRPPRLICVGENHDDATRRFLADTFFAGLKPDLLMIESTEPQRRALVSDGRAYVPLLGADISAVFKAQAGHVRIVGIDQHSHQRGLARDQAILDNFRQAANPHLLSVVLFGALHCGDWEGWFYNMLSQADGAYPPHKRLSVRVVGEHQDGSVEAFVYFLDEIGLKQHHFTITDAGNLPVWVRRAFPVLYDQTLRHYDAVAVFRPE